MISLQKMERLMGKDTNIVFENGVFMEKRFNTIVVGQMQYAKLAWIGDYQTLSDVDQDLLAKMIRARRSMTEFRLKFHLEPKTEVKK